MWGRETTVTRIPRRGHYSIPEKALTSECVRRERPTAEKKVDETPPTQNLKEVLKKKPQSKAQWLEKALNAVRWETMNVSFLFEVLKTPKFSDLGPDGEKLASELYLLIMENLDLFDVVQESFLCSNSFGLCEIHYAQAEAEESEDDVALPRPPPTRRKRSRSLIRTHSPKRPKLRPQESRDSSSAERDHSPGKRHTSTARSRDVSRSLTPSSRSPRSGARMACSSSPASGAEGGGLSPAPEKQEEEPGERRPKRERRSRSRRRKKEKSEKHAKRSRSRARKKEKSEKKRHKEEKKARRSRSRARRREEKSNSHSVSRSG